MSDEKLRELSMLPYQAEAQIVLSDLVVRRLKIDLLAMAVVEKIAAKPFYCMIHVNSPAVAKAWLFAGLLRDAWSRGEEWSLAKLSRLATDADLVVFSSSVQELILSAVAPDPTSRLADTQEKKSEAAAPEKDKPEWDWEYALSLAAKVGLRPDQFWCMTVREFQLYQQSFYEAQQHGQRFDAVMTANVMNCWLKRPVTAEQLLGISNRDGGKWVSQMSPDEKEAFRQRVRDQIHSRQNQPRS